MTSLYDQNQTVWNNLELEGFVSIPRMARHFARASLMDDALGYENATARWARGAGVPSGPAERKARQWVRDTLEKPTPPAFDPVPLPVATGVMLLVVCDNATADRARKMLALIGCEVTEV